MAIEAIAFIAVLVLVVGAKNVAAPTSGQPGAGGGTGPTSGPVAPLAHVTVVYGDDGFSPSSIEVTAPTMVIFQSSSTKDFWPASNNHPTHTLYPGSGISECGKVTDGSNFDACAPQKAGTFWAFIFKEKGTWGYHDHLNPSRTGTVVVK